MKRYITVFAAIAITAGHAFAADGDKPGTDSTFVPPGFVKVFADEMDGKSLDTGKWWTRYIYDNGKLDTLNDERQKFRENNNHVMTGSTLALTAYIKPTNNPRFQYESGMIRSKKTFKYGYFEARLKCPKGLGVWPAFWLNSDADENGKTAWPPEVDFLEFAYNGKEEKENMVHLAVQAKPKKDQPNPWQQSIVSHDPDFKPKGGGAGHYHAPFDFRETWHVFAGHWKSDDTIEILIDGKSIVKFNYKWVLPDGRPAPNAHVLLNLSIGGGWAGRHGIDDSAFPQAFEIDYVRVYQKPGEENVGDSKIGQEFLKATTQPTN